MLNEKAKMRVLINGGVSSRLFHRTDPYRPHTHTKKKNRDAHSTSSKQRQGQGLIQLNDTRLDPCVEAVPMLTFVRFRITMHNTQSSLRGRYYAQLLINSYKPNVFVISG